MGVKLKNTDKPLIMELMKGAYFLSDGVNTTLHNSKVRTYSSTFRRLLSGGYLTDVPHQSKVFDERKYILSPDFDFKKELREETKKYIQSLGKKVAQSKGYEEKLSSYKLNLIKRKEKAKKNSIIYNLSIYL